MSFKAKKNHMRRFTLAPQPDADPTRYYTIEAEIDGTKNTFTGVPGLYLRDGVTVEIMMVAIGGVETLALKAV